MKPDKRRAELRQRLLEAAEQKVAAEGLDALKARDMAATVGCSVGQIYNIYPDLDALILAVNGRTLEKLGAMVTSSKQTTAPSSPEEATAALVAQADAYLQFALNNRNRWQAIFQHRLATDKQQPDWYLELKEKLFSHVAAPLQILLPDMAVEDRARLGRSVFSTVHGVVSLGVEELLGRQSPAELAEQLEIVTGALVRGLQAPSS